MSKPILYQIQEETGSFMSLKNLEEAQGFYNDPSNLNKPLKYLTELQRAEEINNNKRWYSKKALQRGLKGAEKLIENGQWFLESGHPITQDPARFSTISIANSVARVNSYKWNGNILEGQLETLNTALGRDLKGVLLQGVKMGVSMRGMGSVKKVKGIARIEENLRMVCYDVVLNQSHANSMVSKIITEAEVSDMIMHQSEGMKILQESLSAEFGDTIELFNKDQKIDYSLQENAAIVCADGKCMKIFLEDHVKLTFENSFKNTILG